MQLSPLPLPSFPFTVMYLDITADVLLGTPEIPGVLPDLLSALSAPSWLSRPLLCRPLFLAAFTAAVAAPVTLRRSMASLSGLTLAGLVALAAFGTSLLWLSASAVAQGKAHALPLWPDVAALGGGGGTRQILAVLSVLPVLLTADGCHQGVLPLAAMMKPFSRKSMDSVMAVALVSSPPDSKCRPSFPTLGSARNSSWACFSFRVQTDASGL